jgi:hypothetical protein
VSFAKKRDDAAEPAAVHTQPARSEGTGTETPSAELPSTELETETPSTEPETAAAAQATEGTA